jgi:RNA polymerase sigma-70 factor (ECF subfamily)
VADDSELWNRICRGDACAFNQFYLDNAPNLKRFLRRLLGETQAAEDMTQESFLQLWRRPNGYHPEKGLLRTYLFGIGRKRVAEWWRKRTPTADYPAPELADRNTTETSSLVGDAFSRLGPEQQTLLWLREVEGQSYAELAEILEIPVGTVKSRVFTAREELRRIWQMARAQKGEQV